MPEPSHSIKNRVDAARGTLLVTDRAGVVVYANERLSQTTGFGLAETIGRKPGGLWGGRMPRQFYRHLWETIEKRREPFVGQVANERKNGVRYDDMLTIVPIMDQNRRPTLFLAVKPADAASGGLFYEEARQLVPRRDQGSVSTWLWRSLGVSLSTQEQGASLASLQQFLREELIRPLEEKFVERGRDWELIRAAKRDPSQFHLIYEKYRQRVLGYFLRHLSGDQAVAEDLAQDVFYRALRYLPQFREGNAAYGTYLQRIAHNLLVNHYRRELPQSRPVEELGLESETAPQASSKNSLKWLWETQELRPLERNILSSYYAGGLSIREIARKLEKSENAVKLHLSRGRRRLRSILGP